jgi:hypothetical protein
MYHILERKNGSRDIDYMHNVEPDILKETRT